MLHVFRVEYVKGFLISAGFVCVQRFKEKLWTSKQTYSEKVLERFFMLNYIY